MIIYFSDFGLFLFDVISDIVNGVYTIEEGHPIWGGVIIGLVFVPMAVLVAFIGFWNCYVAKTHVKRISLIIILPIIAPVIVVVATPVYVLYVAYVSARRVLQPNYFSRTLPKLLGAVREGGCHGQFADVLRMLEAVLEANMQAITGDWLSGYVRSRASLFHSFYRLW